MKKIPSLFVRDYEKDKTMSGTPLKGRFLATREITPGYEWVINGEGVPTRKWDGTAVLIQGGSIFRRYDAKHGKTPPDVFIPCQDADMVTGHWPGWIKLDHINRDKGNDKYIWEAFWNTFPVGTIFPDGTYEAIGPKIGGNKDKWENHYLVRHGSGGWGNKFYPPNNFTYDGLKKYLGENNIEGIVFHHPDGRMCKVKRTDFGFNW